LGAGLDSKVKCLASYQNYLFASGDFYKTGTDTAFGMARWDGSAWVNLRRTVIGGDADNNGETLNALYADNGLMVGGKFTAGAFGIANNGNNFSRWIQGYNMANSQLVSAYTNGIGIFDDQVSCIIKYKNYYYAGGWYTTVSYYSYSNDNYIPQNITANGLSIMDPPVTGIRKSSLNRISCFPNPSSGKFYIQCNIDQKADPITINIYDLNGALLKSFKTNEDAIEIGLDDLPGGNYFYSITSAKELISYDKFIIIK
jgi:hypothetical protein